MKRAAFLGALVALSACVQTQVPAGGGEGILWRFDRLGRIGGLSVRAEGDPQLVGTPAGPAIVFDGLDDALFFDRHPLAGAATFTAEAIFRPDGGAFEQRWLHLAEVSADPSASAYPPVDPNGPRFLFEIRVVEEDWYLDAFVTGPGYRQVLMFPQKRYPLGRWYHVAQSYDGKTYRSYVNGELQGEAEMAYKPQSNGYASIGTRINRRDYFGGAIYAARFTPKVLSPSQFLKLDQRLQRRNPD